MEPARLSITHTADRSMKKVICVTAKEPEREARISRRMLLFTTVTLASFSDVVLESNRDNAG